MGSHAEAASGPAAWRQGVMLNEDQRKVPRTMILACGRFRLCNSVALIREVVHVMAGDFWKTTSERISHSH